jgi:3-hydroxyacyl-CoA dehydrogenase/enoyl-CoA hydratase/3-hydroxybutyryl-CoA epimerase
MCMSSARHDGRRHRGMVRAAWIDVTLQDQIADRLAPAMGAPANLSERLRDARARFATRGPADSGRRGDGVGRADVVIEAIFENVERSAASSPPSKPGRSRARFLATNTSSHSARETSRPQCRSAALIGLHFFNPVAEMMLVEIVVGGPTGARLRAAARVRPPDRPSCRCRSKSAPGFLVNRVLAALPDGGDAFLVDEGFAPGDRGREPALAGSECRWARSELAGHGSASTSAWRSRQRCWHPTHCAGP